MISSAAALACSPDSHTMNHISNNDHSTNLRPVSLLNPYLLPLYSSLHHPTARGSDNPWGPITPGIKHQLEKPGRGWEISTKLDLQESGQHNVRWIHLVQDTE